MDRQDCCAPRQLTGMLGKKVNNEAYRSLQEKWVIGTSGPADDPVPLVSSSLSPADIWGTWKARWTLGRMKYSIYPGLYGIGKPDRDSPVLVTANYKLTFDSLRKELAGLNAWILVLDTKGINVWCAAGKGTFGSQELIRRIRAVDLSNRLNHHTIILPQLGATGVQAQAVTKATGFKVLYGPVRAADLKAYLAAGQAATPLMRQVRFNLGDRLVLTPAELVFTFKPAAIILGIFFILNAFGIGHYNLIDLYTMAGVIFTGCILAPVLLPWLPGRAFSLKGAQLGLIWALIVCLLNGWPSAPTLEWPKALAYLLILPAVSGFLAMNFTGSSTYTSPSGVNKEMRLALPVMMIAVGSGSLLLLVNDLVRFFH